METLISVAEAKDNQSMMDLIGSDKCTSALPSKEQESIIESFFAGESDCLYVDSKPIVILRNSFLESGPLSNSIVKPIRTRYWFDKALTIIAITDSDGNVMKAPLKEYREKGIYFRSGDFTFGG